MTTATLSTITLYPVKSLAGFSVTRWPVTPTGLQYDRQWLLVDADGQFLTQRRLPRMALIQTAITDGQLCLTAPNMPALSLPLTPTAGTRVSVTIWRDQCPALCVSAAADAWFSQFLGLDCRLVYQTDDMIRPVDADYGIATDRVAFSDGFPFLIIAENSLHALNQAMQLELPMSRFRPNLVVSGCPAYAEDSWRKIRIGALDFRLPKPCSRCAIPTIDPSTALSGKEPLSTLNRTRKWQNNVYFGQNALHAQTGVLTVGDAVNILETGANQPPL